MPSLLSYWDNIISTALDILVGNFQMTIQYNEEEKSLSNIWNSLPTKTSNY